MHDGPREARHASADDLDIALERTPHGNRIVVVRSVLHAAEVDQGGEPDDAAVGDEETDQESDDDAYFALRAANLELQQLGDRKEDDDDIGENVDSTPGVDGDF